MKMMSLGWILYQIDCGDGKRRFIVSLGYRDDDGLELLPGEKVDTDCDLEGYLGGEVVVIGDDGVVE